MSFFDRLSRLARAEWSARTDGSAEPGELEDILDGLPGGKGSAGGRGALGEQAEFVEPDDPPERPEKRGFPKEIRQAYGTLELPLGADREAARAAHRRLIKQHHPDRHDDDGPRERAATERTLRIREAWERLDTWLG